MAEKSNEISSSHFALWSFSSAPGDRVMYALAGALLVAWSAPTLACAVKVDVPFPWSAQRVVRISLRLQHAAITGLPTLPAGWRFTIDNDPSWNAHLEGRAIIGAAFTASSELSKLIVVSPETGYTCSDLAKENAATLSATLYKDDHLRTRRLPLATIQIVEDANPKAPGE